MTATDSVDTAQEEYAGGRRASDRLRTPRETAARMLNRYFVDPEDVPPPRDCARGELDDMATTCSELAAGVLDSGRLPIAGAMDTFRDAATRWARDGVPLGRIQHAINEGCALGLRAAESAVNREAGAAGDDRTILIMELLNVVTEAVSDAYLTEFRTLAQNGPRHDVELLDALLTGDGTARRIADRMGALLAEEYHVVALHFPAHADEGGRRGDAAMMAARKLRRIHAALAAHNGDIAPIASISATGGTVLLPDVPGADVDELVERLADAGQIAVTATTGSAAIDDISVTAPHLYELLSLVRRLHYTPGTYRISDLVFEYQVSRPGLGRKHLVTLIDPLRDSVDLLPTLQAFVDSDSNRKKTATWLTVHPNTVDYRLKRVDQLTGLDPMKPSGLRRLHAALIADRLEARRTPVDERSL
ncbi:MAG: helix-turn-helix domain-containing protein [Rhodococcus sp.]|uniref:PucR family transcriptional regulator n=1 Tax=Nocardiaceae TaxID=85025 RepID=UPI00050C9902|nr:MULTISPECIES: PucR family transcriptional regulator [Rhodococcus]MBJ7349493.1 helix-turn-helix domain-containing protein [Rhodococcus sp. (in: high G+C Gram-positive bacteria)]MCX6492422.1 helix-turn-helix domain-containing protein [Rhodococcus sp. (in: high G+C Gram-positive bacteria)]MDJ0428778.1 helix-turn-helix domain-containing protein [Rhodococcus fascians]MDJ0470036.1 helix-turn-helix domain-containing protein [Rhodococcus fascians]WQH26973.1 helix-turn-helix domain-containing protei